MINLLVSKVNDIRVIQVGDSKMSVSNKNEDGSKVGGRLADGTVGNGFNQTVDLGRGKQQHTINLYTASRDDTDALFKIFHEERFCTIVDKFKGRLKVYVEEFEVTDSDTHIGRTIFEITCMVQDEEILPSVNTAVALANELSKMEKELESMVVKLAAMCDEAKTKLDMVTGKLSFTNSSLELLRKGVMSIIDVQVAAYNAYGVITNRANTSKRLFDSILNIKSVPSGVSNLLKGVTNGNNIKTTTKSNNSVTGKANEIQRGGKSEIVEIAEPQIRGIELSRIDRNILSQFELEQLERDEYAYQIVSKVKVIRDMKSMLIGGFNSQDDFEKTVDAVIERLMILDYSIEEASRKAHIVKMFANEQRYRHIIEIEVSNPKPLMAIVYERYGSLDNYDSIEAINGFKDNDYIQGKVKVFS